MDKAKKALVSKLEGSLPRYAKSDDKDTPVVIETGDLNLALQYLRGER